MFLLPELAVGRRKNSGQRHPTGPQCAPCRFSEDWDYSNWYESVLPGGKAPAPPPFSPAFMHTHVCRPLCQHSLCRHKSLRWRRVTLVTTVSDIDGPWTGSDDRPLNGTAGLPFLTMHLPMGKTFLVSVQAGKDFKYFSFPESAFTILLRHFKPHRRSTKTSVSFCINMTEWRATTLTK